LRDGDLTQPRSAREPEVGTSARSKIEGGDLTRDLVRMHGIRITTSGAESDTFGRRSHLQQREDRRLEHQVAEYAQHVEPLRLCERGELSVVPRALVSL
jgi:hypothetical protein